MTEVSETLVVQAPPGSVWEVLDDTGRYAEWVEDVLSVPYHHGPAAPGGTFRERNRWLGPLRVSTTWTVRDVERPRFRRDSGTGMPLVHDLEAIFELEPITTADRAQATRWTYTNRYRPGLGALGRGIDALQQPSLRAMMRRSMARLAELVER